MLIEILDLTKIFCEDKVEKRALSDVHLTISRGEFVALTGPAGSGKSTLMSIIGLFESATYGTYLLNGKAVEGLRSIDRTCIRRQEFGFLFKNHGLAEDLTAYENVESPLKMHWSFGHKARHRSVMASMERVGMSRGRHKYPWQLTAGMQQRVAVARALVRNPSLLLADEPTWDLRKDCANEVMTLLRKLNRDGLAICIFTADPSIAKYADREIRLVNGEVVCQPEPLRVVHGRRDLIGQV